MGRAEVAADAATLCLAWRAEPPRMLGRAACLAEVPGLLQACTRELFDENRARLLGQIVDIAQGDSLAEALSAAPTSAVSLCDDPDCERSLDAVLDELGADPVGHLVEPPDGMRPCWRCGRSGTHRMLCGHKVRGEK